MRHQAGLPGAAPPPEDVRPLVFNWGAPEAVTRPAFETYRDSIVLQALPEGQILEIVGLEFTGEPTLDGATSLGAARAEAVKKLFAGKLPEERLAVSARQEAEPEDARKQPFEAVIFRFIEPATLVESLQELDKAKTRFFSNITHEFRTPLTLIIGPLEQALSEQPPPTILRRRMQGILKNAHHLLGLINQLLDLSKIEGRQMKVEAAQGDLIEYTRELVQRFLPLARKKRLRMSFLAGQDCWETYFDKEKWDKIVFNLLSNAIGCLASRGTSYGSWFG